MSFYTESKVVDSSSIKTVYYDVITQEMFVEFHNGNYAGYSGVNVMTYRDFIKAPSVGKFYNSWIRGVYNGVPVSSLERRADISLSDNGPLTVVGTVNSSVSPVYRDYTVRGYVLVEETYFAASPEEAVSEFEQDYDDVSVKEVVVSFE